MVQIASRSITLKVPVDVYFALLLAAERERKSMGAVFYQCAKPALDMLPRAAGRPSCGDVSE